MNNSTVRFASGAAASSSVNLTSKSPGGRSKSRSTLLKAFPPGKVVPGCVRPPPVAAKVVEFRVVRIAPPAYDYLNVKNSPLS